MCASVRQGCALSALLFALYFEPLCRRINNSTSIQGFTLESSEVRVMTYADEVAFFCINKQSVSNALSITQESCDVTGSLVNSKSCVGLWHGEWRQFPRIFQGVTWSSEPTCYGRVPLQL